MFVLEPLPYAIDALQPVISKETIEYHYGKHHQTYIDNLNKLIKGTELEKLSLEEIVIQSSDPALFNNAAQAWNHHFYWNCLTPEKSAGPKDGLAKAIEKSFGSLPEFEKLFEKNANDFFGSGWVWLVGQDTQLKIQTTSNAMNPLKTSGIPILGCDIWEHAYYIDYRNNRTKYLSGFWKIMNWDFAEENYINLCIRNEGRN